MNTITIIPISCRLCVFGICVSSISGDLSCRSMGLFSFVTLYHMGNWLSSDKTLTCASGTKRVNDKCVSDITSGSGTKRVNDECVPADVEFNEILQKYILRQIGERSNEQDCEYLGGEYKHPRIKSYIVTDPLTGQSSTVDEAGSGKCDMPRLNVKEERIIQQGLCGRKLNSKAEFCKKII